MAITVQCPNSGCSASSVIADSFSGRKMRCKKCNTPFVVQPTFDGQKSDTQKSHPSANANPFPVLPAEFGRYRVIKLLGRGGMGAVYLAEDTQLGRQVALKIPFFDAKESPQRIERFVREARSAAALSHPNICTVFDSGQIDGRHFITMELLDGSPLESEIGRGLIAEPRAAEIAFQVAEALGYAHGKGTVHRDLKPANIMISADGEPVVMDFGLAKQLLVVDPNEAKLSRDGGLLGTPSYMSPEQVKGDIAAIGPATDIYSLGVVLFEMLTGSTPYSGSMGAVLGQIIGAPVPPLSEFCPDADPRLEVICRKAMAKAPADRFPSMAKFANALGKYLQEPGAARVPKPAPAAAPIPSPVVPSVYQDPAPILAPQRVPVPQSMPTPVEAFGDLHDVEEPEPSPKKTARKQKSRLPVYLGLAVALAVLLPLGIWLGVTLLRVETPNGTLIVEIADDEVEARIKGGKLVLSGPDGKPRYTLAAGERDKKLDAGAYKIRVEGADGLTLDTPEFILKKGDKVTVRVTMEKKQVAKKEEPKSDPQPPIEPNPTPQPPPVEPKVPPRPATDYAGLAKNAWVSALPTIDEYKRIQDLKSFTGNLAKFENGVLEFDAGRIFVPKQLARDAIIRVQVKKEGNRKNASLILRSCDRGHIVGWFDGDGVFGIGLQIFGSPWKVLTSRKLPDRYDDYFEMAFSAVGDRFTVYVDGRGILETENNELNAANGGIGVGGTGHGWMRKIEFQVLDEAPPQPVGLGFVPLFNGKDLTGWKAEAGKLAAWDWKAGVLTCTGDQGWLMTEKQYSNYELRMEYKLATKANSGVALRSKPDGRLAKELELEVQILDDEWYVANFKGLRNDQRNGALYEIVSPSPAASKPVGEWNTLHIAVIGRTITVQLNGVKIVDADLDTHIAKAERFPGLLRASGRIGLAGSDTRIEFRKIEIKELQSSDDPIQPGTLWIIPGAASSLTITKRSGDEFAGIFGNGRTIERKVKGTVKNGKIAWFGKDVEAIKGGPGDDNFGTIVQDKDGWHIDVTFKRGDQLLGSTLLRLRPK